VTAAKRANHRRALQDVNDENCHWIDLSAVLFHDACQGTERPRVPSHGSKSRRRSTVVRRRDAAYHNATKACFTDIHWLFKPWIDQAFGPIDNLHDVVAAGQFYGGEGLRYIYDALRRRGKRIGGITSHCFSEPWPNAAASYMIDCDGRSLMNFDFVKQAMPPISVSLKMQSPLYDTTNGVNVGLFLVSDAPNTEKNLSVSWTVHDCHGRILDHAIVKTGVAPLEVKSLGEIAICPVKETCDGPILVELSVQDAMQRLLTERVHLFVSSAVAHPFRGLLKNQKQNGFNDARQRHRRRHSSDYVEGETAWLADGRRR
jgi:hypothetical protein